jgi:hypothetical protein
MGPVPGRHGAHNAHGNKRNSRRNGRPRNYASDISRRIFCVGVCENSGESCELGAGAGASQRAGEGSVERVAAGMRVTCVNMDACVYVCFSARWRRCSWKGCRRYVCCMCMYVCECAGEGAVARSYACGVFLLLYSYIHTYIHDKLSRCTHASIHTYIPCIHTSH